MSRLFIYTPGSNDIKIYHQPEKEVIINKNIIEPSKQIVNLLNKNKDYRMDEKGIVCETPLDMVIEEIKQSITIITFPIIAALLTYINEILNGNKKDLQEEDNDAYSTTFLLIASNQDSQHPMDTLYVCDLIKKYLIEYGKVKDVIIEEITCNVSNYDKVSGFFQSLMEKRKSLFENTLELYRILGPGTPAMNTGGMHLDFAFHVRNLYAERSSSGDTEIREMGFFSSFKKRDEAGNLKLFLANYNYKAAVMFLQKTFLRPENVIIDALTLVDYRKYMNYKEGSRDSDVFNQCYIKQATDKSLYNFLYSQICFFYKLKNYTPGSMDMIKIAAREFYFLMECDIKTGDYNALIAHLFTFFENLDEYLFYVLTDKTFIKAGKEGFKELREFLDDNDDIWVDIKKQTGKEDKNEMEPVYQIKKIIFDNLEKRCHQTDLIKEYREIQNDTICKLRDLRNKGPFAHGYFGVNSDTFKSEMLYKEKGVNGLLELTLKVFKLNGFKLSIDESKNPYVAFNKGIYNYIERQL